MPKIFIVKEQMIRGETGPIPMDYTPAMEYGDIEFITTHDLPMYGRSSVLDAWMEDVARFCRIYDPAHDFIVTTGQPMAIFMIGWMLARFNKTPHFLVWRREENRYRAVHFTDDFLNEVHV